MKAPWLLLAITTLSPPAAAQQTPCAISDITIKSQKGGFASTAGRQYFRGIAVLTNRCKEAVGVHVKVTGLDAAGAPVRTKEGWPASVRNIPPGDYDFSLDHWLEFDPAIRSFTVRVIEVKHWR